MSALPACTARRHLLWRAGPVLLSAGLAACGSAPRRIGPVPSSPYGSDVVIQAVGLVGTPYRLGGNDLDSGVDCSAFIGLVYRRATPLSLPRTVASLQRWGRPVDRDRVEPGDVILFTPVGASAPTHGGIVVGGGRFVHAPSTGGRVRVDSLSLAHWARQGWTVRRP